MLPHLHSHAPFFLYLLIFKILFLSYKESYPAKSPFSKHLLTVLTCLLVMSSLLVSMTILVQYICVWNQTGKCYFVEQINHLLNSFLCYLTIICDNSCKVMGSV